MNASFDVTPRQLIAYLHGHCRPEEVERIRAALAASEELRQRLQQLHEASVELALASLVSQQQGELSMLSADSLRPDRPEVAVRAASRARNRWPFVLAAVSLAGVVLLAWFASPFFEVLEQEAAADITFAREADAPTTRQELTAHRESRFPHSFVAPPSNAADPTTDENAARQSGIEPGLAGKEGKDYLPVPEKDIQSDDVVIDDTTIAAYFEYLGKERPIYMSKSFVREYGGRVPTDIPLGNTQFYIKPDVILLHGELQKAFAEKTKVRDSADGPIYRMRFTVKFWLPELKEAAVKRLNELFSQQLTVANVAIVRPQGLQLLTERNGRLTVLQRRPVPVHALSDSWTVDVEETEPALQAFAQDGVVLASYNLRGWRVRQDAVIGTFQTLFSSQLSHSLTGQGGFKKFQEMKRASGSTGFNLFGILGGQNTSASTLDTVAFSSWVTRRQIRDVAETALQFGIVSGWFETSEDSKNAALDSVLEIIIAKCAETNKLNVQAAHDDTIGKEVYTVDGKPDEIGEIALHVKEKHELEAHDKPEIETDGKKVTAKQDRWFKHLDDVDWDSKTGPSGTKIYVPKSITVYQLNSAKLAEQLKMVVINNQAEYVERPGAYEYAVVIRNIAAKHQEFQVAGSVVQPGPQQRVSGDDGDVYSNALYRLDLSCDPLGGAVARETAVAIRARLWIKEDQPDWTELLTERTHEHQLRPAPQAIGKKIVRLGPIEDLHANGKRPSADHSIFDVPGTSTFFNVRIKTDDHGAEDEKPGNTGYWFDFRIPYTVEVESAYRELRVRDNVAAEWHRFE